MLTSLIFDCLAQAHSKSLEIVKQHGQGCKWGFDKQTENLQL